MSSPTLLLCSAYAVNLILHDTFDGQVLNSGLPSDRHYTGLTYAIFSESGTVQNVGENGRALTGQKNRRMRAGIRRNQEKSHSSRDLSPASSQKQENKLPTRSKRLFRVCRSDMYEKPRGTRLKTVYDILAMFRHRQKIITGPYSRKGKGKALPIQA